MKTQSSRQHTNVVAVQPQTTSFHKEDRMNRHSSTALKMAIIFAMVVTLAMTAPSAGAQTLLRYLQMPGSGTHVRPNLYPTRLWPGAGNRDSYGDDNVLRPNGRLQQGCWRLPLGNRHPTSQYVQRQW